MAHPQARRVRFVLVALASLAAVLSGCIAEGGVSGGASYDCSHSLDQATGQMAEVVLPSEAPMDRPQVQVEARAGQGLVAVATWQADVGEAQAVLDGPSRHLVQPGNTMTLSTEQVAAGTYTLSLEGAPLAAGMRYTLTLLAHGCTPALR